MATELWKRLSLCDAICVPCHFLYLPGTEGSNAPSGLVKRSITRPKLLELDPLVTDYRKIYLYASEPKRILSPSMYCWQQKLASPARLRSSKLANLFIKRYLLLAKQRRARLHALNREHSSVYSDFPPPLNRNQISRCQEKSRGSNHVDRFHRLHTPGLLSRSRHCLARQFHLLSSSKPNPDTP